VLVSTAASAAPPGPASGRAQQRAARIIRGAVVEAGLFGLLNRVVARGLRLLLAAKQQGAQVPQAAAAVLGDAQAAASTLGVVWLKQCINGAHGLTLADLDSVIGQATDPGEPALGASQHANPGFACLIV
jgi:hypothetical protein